jgi:AcrR family transcriptional regulator
MPETKKHILTVALRLFIQNGYREVTFQKLIEAAGVSKGSFYHYWPGKKELFREVVELFFMEYFRGFQLGAPETSMAELFDTFAADFQTMMNEIAAVMGAEGTPFGYYLLVLEAIRVFPELQAGMGREYERYTSEVEAVVARAQAGGEITDRISAREVAGLIIPEIEGSALLAFIRQEENIGDVLRTRLRSLYTLLTPPDPAE